MGGAHDERAPRKALGFICTMVPVRFKAGRKGVPARTGSEPSACLRELENKTRLAHDKNKNNTIIEKGRVAIPRRLCVASGHRRFRTKTKWARYTHHTSHIINACVPAEEAHRAGHSLSRKAPRYTCTFARPPPPPPRSPGNPRPPRPCTPPAAHSATGVSRSPGQHRRYTSPTQPSTGRPPKKTRTPERENTDRFDFLFFRLQFRCL